MAEIVLGAVGLVPVLVETLKAYKTIHSYIRTARKCVKKLEDIELDLEIQRERFLNEWTLLLKAAGVDEKNRGGMLRDPEHKGWNDALETKMQSSLGLTCELCWKILVRVAATQRDMTEMLAHFEKVRNGKESVS